MKQQYATQPEAVEVHRVGRSSDVILRKNIEEVTKADDETSPSYTVYECDEVQFRYPGTLQKEDVAADFDTWWDYPGKSATAASTGAKTSLEQQVTDLQLAVTEVYEMFLTK